jgi:carbonic anhydrase
MDKLIVGVRKFQSEVFAAQRDLFRELSEKQEPRILFITCSDSRMDPLILTQSQPGELFILRNVGNIVPSYSGTLGGTTATIEYAVGLLHVKHIVVCGHTDCGAMKALLYPDLIQDLPALRNWMVQAESTRRIVREQYTHLKDDALLLATIQENVRSQLDHLKTHPTVASGLRRKSLSLHGWVYAIPTAEIWTYQDARGEFVRLEGGREP